MQETKAPPTVDDYLARIPADVQPVAQKLRQVILASAPGAVEKISYGMPGYYLNGGLLSFGVWKRHIALYPRSTEMDAAIPGLSAYKGTKGSIHFPLDQPLPYDLIAEIVKFRLAENLKK